MRENITGEKKRTDLVSSITKVKLSALHNDNCDKMRVGNFCYLKIVSGIFTILDANYITTYRSFMCFVQNT